MHLTHRRTLDALGLDGRINSGRLDVGPDPLLVRAQALADAVWDWWDGAPPALVHRSRTTPTARSMAFTEATAWAAVSARQLREAVGLHAALVLRHGFDVPEDWLA